MKVLMLFPYAPLPPPLDLAGTKRNLPFFLELTKRHEVSVLSFGNPEEEALFRQSYGAQCAEIRFVNRKRPRIFSALQLLWLLGTGRSSFSMLYRRAMQRAINEMTSNRRYDVIHCCVHMFGSFRFPTDVPVTSDTHEVKYDLIRRTAENTSNPLQRLLLSLSWRLGKPEELAFCRKFDLLIATTGRDLQVFRQELPCQNMVTIQNGAGASFFEDVKIEPEPFTMVFTGLFTHQPNTQGMLWFLREIFPLIVKEAPQARIFVVGKNPPNELKAMSSDNVVVTGFVEDVRPYMARAQVFVIPLLAGGGIRGKALEAMAMKKPIVTTAIGVEGIHLFNGQSSLFADQPAAFANAVLQLFQNAALRERIGGNAYATVKQHYNWEAKGNELDRALDSVVQKHTQPTRKNSLPSAATQTDGLGALA